MTPMCRPAYSQGNSKSGTFRRFWINSPEQLRSGHWSRSTVPNRLVVSAAAREIAEFVRFGKVKIPPEGGTTNKMEQLNERLSAGKKTGKRLEKFDFARRQAVLWNASSDCIGESGPV